MEQVQLIVWRSGYLTRADFGPPGTGKPQADAACLNAGDWIIDCGTESDTDPRGLLNPMPSPVGEADEADVVGSGKVFSPCARMHWARWTSSTLTASGDGAEAVLAASARFLHALMADWNAGDCRLTPAPAICCPTSSPGVGSGKLGTPCARMQSASLIPAVSRLEAEMLGLAEDPQAATAMEQATARRASLSGLFACILRALERR